MRLGIWGAPGDTLAAQLVERARRHGLAVETAPADAWSDDVAAACCGLDAAIVTMVGHRDSRQAFLRRLDEALPAETPLLACCHDAAAAQLASGLGCPGRLVGYGLVPPVAERQRVECARSLDTNDEAAERAVGVWRALGLEPVWVGDGAGLVTARIVACLANEAAFALSDGTATAADIDRAMTLGTRYPRGPLAWASEIGLDHVLAILDGLALEHGDDRYRASPLIRRLVAAGRTRGPVW